MIENTPQQFDLPASLTDIQRMRLTNTLNHVWHAIPQDVAEDDKQQIITSLLQADPSKDKEFTPYLCRLYLQSEPSAAATLIKEDLPKAKAYLWAFQKLTTQKDIPLSLYWKIGNKREMVSKKTNPQPKVMILPALFAFMQEHLSLFKGEPLPDYVHNILGDDILYSAPGKLSQHLNITDPEELRLIENGDITVLANNHFYKYVQLNTIAGSRYVGRGTQWCTAMRDKRGENNFNNYSNRAPLSVLMIRGSAARYQFHFAPYGVNDAADNPVDFDQILQHFTDYTAAQKMLENDVFSLTNVRQDIEYADSGNDLARVPATYWPHDPDIEKIIIDQALRFAETQGRAYNLPHHYITTYPDLPQRVAEKLVCHGEKNGHVPELPEASVTAELSWRIRELPWTWTQQKNSFLTEPPKEDNYFALTVREKGLIHLLQSHNHATNPLDEERYVTTVEKIFSTHRTHPYFDDIQDFIKRYSKQSLTYRISDFREHHQLRLLKLYDLVLEEKWHTYETDSVISYKVDTHDGVGKYLLENCHRFAPKAQLHILNWLEDGLIEMPKNGVLEKNLSPEAKLKLEQITAQPSRTHLKGATKIASALSQTQPNV